MLKTIQINDVSPYIDIYIVVFFYGIVEVKTVFHDILTF